MAGIIHEVERTDLLEQVRQEAADAARQLAEAARLRRGSLSMRGSTIVSIKRLMRVDLPVRTGPTTPM